MTIRRRDALFGAATLAALAPARALAVGTGGPALWTASRGSARVHIFGIADAKDRSWFSPAIQRAFDDSTQIWFETPHSNPDADDLPPLSPAVKALARDEQHNLFDQLDAPLSQRLLAAAEKYGVAREALEHEAPWHAYFVLNRGYWAWRAKNGLGDVSESPDNVLAAMAWKANKQVLSECPTADDITLDFINMPPVVAREHLINLLDYFDEEAAGGHADRFDWIKGVIQTHDIEMMCKNTPALYEYEHVRRNKIWALRIDNLLSYGGAYFIAIGRNHTVGPHSMLKQMADRSIVAVRTA